MADRIYKIDSGYSSTSPASTYSSMSPSQSSQDVPYQDLQSLQLSQVLNCNDLDNPSITFDIKFNQQNEQSDQQYMQMGTQNYSAPNYPQQAKLEIVEQPVSKFRYRYISEMHGTHGSLMGANSSKSNKSFPTVELKGFTGEALIRCTLYQMDKKQPHSHRLVVRRHEKDIPDPHELRLNPIDGYRAVFQGMGIIHTAKRDITNELYLKKKSSAEFEKGSALTEKEQIKLKHDSEKESKQMNLNQVVLRFEAYEIINNQLRQLCDPIYSNPISNMKCALTGELKITRLSTIVSSAAGGDDLFLFVEKVGKKNIKVRFFEIENDTMVWSDYGSFAEADVHHQYAIALRTPPYKNKDIDKYVNVFIQLERISDGDRSEPLEFKYKPRDCVSSRKRARTSSSGFGSFELPTTISNNGSGTTISEEFGKNNILESLFNDRSFLYNEDTFVAQVKNDSSELLKFMDPNIFLEDDNVELDCGIDLRTPLNQRKYSTKYLLLKINHIMKTGKLGGLENHKIRESVKEILLECNEKNQDLLHRIVQNREIKEGIFLLNTIKEFELQETLNWVNDDGDNCLHVACTFDCFMFIRTFLSLGANPNKQNRKGKTPLHIAVEENFQNSIKTLLDKNNYISNYSIPLHIDLANDDGYTALHIAIKKQNLDIVKLLLDGKASTKICCSKNGNNALHLAVEQNCHEIVSFLITTPVKINGKNSSGFTPLTLAQSYGEKGKHLVDIILNKTESLQNKEKKNSQNEKCEKSDSSSGESDDDRSIRSLKIAEDCEDHNTLDNLNEELIENLSEILVKDNKWIRLSEFLNLHSYACLWKTPKAMLTFINESKEYTIDDLVEALNIMNEVEAIDVIKNYRCHNN